LIRVNIKSLSKLDYGLVAYDRGNRHLSLEGRSVVPTGSSHGLLLFAGRFFDQQRADSSLSGLSD
jgi:hypothetical protein